MARAANYSKAIENGLAIVMGDAARVFPWKTSNHWVDPQDWTVGTAAIPIGLADWQSGGDDDEAVPGQQHDRWAWLHGLKLDISEFLGLRSTTSCFYGMTSPRSSGVALPCNR